MDQEKAAEIKRKVREFITSNFYVPEASRLTDQSSLLDSGIVDSTGMLEVIAFLESDFTIQVSDRDLVPENLDSIERIAAYIARRRAEGPPT
ncbi:MAG: acyl carrier protein [Polyangiaceae bacterium]|nr:acyl carrier protein [Polyangiaceae bacterium]